MAKNLNGFTQVQIVSLRNGSIIVELEVIYTDSNNIPEETLRGLVYLALIENNPENNKIKNDSIIVNTKLVTTQTTQPTITTTPPAIKTYQYTLMLKINDNFQTVYTNKSSLEYKQLEMYITQFVNSSLRSYNLTGFKDLQILNLKNGSILTNSKYTYEESTALSQEQIRILSLEALSNFNLNSIVIANLQSPPLANETTYDHTFYIYMDVNGTFNLSNPDEYARSFPQIQEFLTTSALNITQTTKLSIISTNIFLGFYEVVANFTLLGTRFLNESDAREALLTDMLAYTGPFPVNKSSIRILPNILVATTIAPQTNKKDEINAVAIFVPIIIVLVVVAGFGALFFYKLKKSVRLCFYLCFYLCFK